MEPFFCLPAPPATTQAFSSSATSSWEEALVPLGLWEGTLRLKIDSQGIFSSIQLYASLFLGEESVREKVEEIPYRRPRGIHIGSNYLSTLSLILFPGD